jgi:RimJ/RimL family protein N-acetyltransferase
MGMSNVVIAGFNFFREFWDHKTTDAAGVVAFNYWFTASEPPVEVVLGSCPATHVVALRYNKRVGLKETGRIPLAHIFKGERCDAVLVAMTREEWRIRGGKQ